LTKVQRAVFI